MQVILCIHAIVSLPGFFNGIKALGIGAVHFASREMGSETTCASLPVIRSQFAALLPANTDLAVT